MQFPPVDLGTGPWSKRTAASQTEKSGPMSGARRPRGSKGEVSLDNADAVIDGATETEYIIRASGESPEEPTCDPTTQTQKIPRRKRSPPPRPLSPRHPANRAGNPRQAQKAAQAQKESAQRSFGLNDKAGRFPRNLVSRPSTRLIIRDNITRLEQGSRRHTVHRSKFLSNLFQIFLRKSRLADANPPVRPYQK